MNVDAQPGALIEGYALFFGEKSVRPTFTEVRALGESSRELVEALNGFDNVLFRRPRIDCAKTQ